MSCRSLNFSSEVFWGESFGSDGDVVEDLLETDVRKIQTKPTQKGKSIETGTADEAHTTCISDDK